MPLTDLQARKEAPGAKPKKLFDGGGLYLLVNPNGSKWWRWKYHFGKREQLLALGVFPEVSLKAARLARDAARLQLAAGVNPMAARQAQRRGYATTNTLEAIADEFLLKQSKKLSAGTLEKAKWMATTTSLTCAAARSSSPPAPRSRKASRSS